MQIRLINRADNHTVGNIIREVLTEFGANRPGFAWQDPELDSMAEAYDLPDRLYRVCEVDGEIVGVGGLGPFVCAEYPNCCELQKMYFRPHFRGKGLGYRMLDTLLQDARKLDYDTCYLESLSSMDQAIKLYLRLGFRDLSQPLGDSGHNACDRWLLKAL